MILSFHVLPSLGHLSMSREIFSCHNRMEGATGIQWAEARDASKHLTIIHLKMSTVARLSNPAVIPSSVWSFTYSIYAL